MTKLFIRKNENGIFYYKDPEMTIYHREDGPAVERYDGAKFWYQNNKLHRLDGPAAEYTNGIKAWHQNGLYHRLDGPAVEHVNGAKEYWIEGEKLTEQEFLARTQAPTCDKIVTIDGVDYKLTKI